MWLQALPNLMPGFDKEIAKLAQRVLINPRPIDWHTGVLATKVTPGQSQGPAPVGPCLHIPVQEIERLAASCHQLESLLTDLPGLPCQKEVPKGLVHL